jgi:hypothetical protein
MFTAMRRASSRVSRCAAEAPSQLERVALDLGAHDDTSASTVINTNTARTPIRAPIKNRTAG